MIWEHNTKHTQSVNMPIRCQTPQKIAEERDVGPVSNIAEIVESRLGYTVALPFCAAYLQTSAFAFVSDFFFCVVTQQAASTIAGVPAMKAASDAPWVQSAQEVIAQQQTSLDSGLTSGEVEKRRQQYGYNELDKEPGKPLWKLVLEQFDDMLVKVAA